MHFEAKRLFEIKKNKFIRSDVSNSRAFADDANGNATLKRYVRWM